MFEIDPKFHAHPDWPRESELPTAEDVRGILPKPEPAEPSVPLSAIRALVQQWREDAEKATIVARRRALQVCADELEDICEDACLPPEDQS